MPTHDLPAARQPPVHLGLTAQIQLSMVPHQSTAPQEVRSQLVDSDGEMVGEVSVTIDERALALDKHDHTIYRPAIVNALLDNRYQKLGLSYYLVYNLATYLETEYDAQFPDSAEKYTVATHICIEGDAGDGFWTHALSGVPGVHGECDLILTIGQLLTWSTDGLKRLAERKKSASKWLAKKKLTRQGTPYGGGRRRKRKTKTKKNRRSRLSHRRHRRTRRR